MTVYVPPGRLAVNFPLSSVMTFAATLPRMVSAPEPPTSSCRSFPMMTWAPARGTSFGRAIWLSFLLVVMVPLRVAAKALPAASMTRDRASQKTSDLRDMKNLLVGLGAATCGTLHASGIPAGRMASRSFRWPPLRGSLQAGMSALPDVLKIFFKSGPFRPNRTRRDVSARIRIGATGHLAQTAGDRSGHPVRTHVENVD